MVRPLLACALSIAVWASVSASVCTEFMLMRYRPLQKLQWAAQIGIPQDEEELIRHYTLSGADIDCALIKRGEHNQLGFAVQLCLMRFPGRALGPNKYCRA